MLYALGLRGAEANVGFASHAKPYHPALQPQTVMQHFLKGGVAQLQPNLPVVQFDPYDVEKMLEVLQASRIRGLSATGGIKPPQASGPPGQKLTNLVLNEIVAQDPLLAKKYQDFLDEPERASASASGSSKPNSDFFQNPPPGETVANTRVTDKFWLYLLQKYGYILPK